MKYFIIIIMFLLWLLACSEEKKKKEVPKFYSLPLKIGNEYQLALQNDSTVFVNSIITDTVYRIDGQKLFKRVLEYPEYSLVSYLYHKDGFLIGSSVDTLFDSSDSSVYIPENPFYENRLARTNPFEGETWEHILYEDPTEAHCFKAVRIEKYDTYLGELKDVFRYELHDKLDDELFMSVIYSNGQGQVGTVIYYDLPVPDTSILTVSYIKINGEEYGEKIVSKDDGLEKKALPERNFPEAGSFFPYGILSGIRIPEKDVFMKDRRQSDKERKMKIME